MSLLLLMIDFRVVGFNQDMEEDGQDLRQRQAELLEQQRLEEEAAQEQQRQEEVLRQQQAELLEEQLQQDAQAQEQQRQEAVRQLQEEEAARIQGQQQHHQDPFHRVIQSRPKTSDHVKLSEKTRDDLHDSVLDTRTEAHAFKRRSKQIADNTVHDGKDVQQAPSADQHRKEMDVLNTLEGELLEEFQGLLPIKEI